jgi:hypothetical protein
MPLKYEATVYHIHQMSSLDDARQVEVKPGFCFRGVV